MIAEIYVYIIQREGCIKDYKISKGYSVVCGYSTLYINYTYMSMIRQAMIYEC